MTKLLTPTKRLLFTPANRDLVRLGKKTETRRIMNPPPDPTAAKLIYSHGYEWIATSNSGKIGIFSPSHHRSRYGCPQREPVRYYLAEPVQVLALNDGTEDSPLPWVELIYLDDGKDATPQACEITFEDKHNLLNRTKGWDAPSTSLFMLKSFARTWMKGIRVWPERLGDMSDESALAEGVTAYYQEDRFVAGTHCTEVYRAIWEDINGPGSWDAERWVWCVKFELEGNPNA